jgi:uncharacterized protein (DUF58 family)
MMDSPEARGLIPGPWLFGRQGMALLALITAIAATFLATDVTYLAGALLVVGLAARAWAWLAFARVGFSRHMSRARAFCGDELVLDAMLANPRPLPLPWVEVWENLPAALSPAGANERSFAQPDRVWVSRGIAAWPYQRLRWRRTLVCRRRGVFRLGDIRLRAGDPFGFFERERLMRDSVELLVYPRVVPLRQLGLPLHHPSIDIVSPASPVSDPTRTAAIRDYRPGDPQRLIHWPTTARRGTLQVRVLEPATSLNVSLLLDVRGFGFGVYQQELLEQTLSAVASIAVFLQGEGAPVALLANTNPPLVIPPGASVPHLQQVLESLARLKPRAGPALVPWALEVLPRGNTVLLAASDVCADLGYSIAHLQDADFTVVSVLAMNRPRANRLASVAITPGCDLAARLEGRG